MRTTVTLDPDAEQIVRERMAAKGVTFKQALNDAIRDGVGRVDYVFDMPAYDLGLRVDVTKANRLAGEIEDEAIVAKLRGSR